jgi:glycosyltransferase involved in cell wall biosynthesis
MTFKNGRTEFVKKEFYKRFNPDEEFLGRDKPVNQVQPVLSVCVPTYQHEEFIAECLESILAQKTNFVFEILIGEDGSSDKTRQICKDYARNNTDKIRLFLRDRETSQLYDEKGEFLIRFNVKWLRLSARGKYIALCEGDDYWTDNYKIQKQIDFMEFHPDYSMCFHNAKVMYEDKREPHNFVDLPEGKYSGLDMYENHIVPTASVVFAVDCIEGKDYLFNSNFFFGDLILFLTLAECGKVWFFEETMCVYRKHKGGMMHRVFEDSENVRKFIIHQKQILETFPVKYKQPGFKNISWFYFILFRVSFRENLFESIMSLLKSFYYSPLKCFEEARKFLRKRLIRSNE